MCTLVHVGDDEKRLRFMNPTQIKMQCKFANNILNHTYVLLYIY
jgi:hypothetical protein